MPTVRPTPKRFPVPEFPPRKPRRFSRMPPAIFPALLGLLGLGLALRRGLAAFGANPGLADLLLGMAAMLWGCAVFAYLAKLAQRPAVLVEDARVLPGRTGLAAATMGGMAVAAALVPVAPGLALGLLLLSLVAHGALAITIALALWRLPRAARPVDPGWHLCFAGFILGGVAAQGLGLASLVQALIGAALPVAGAIWLLSAWALWRSIPPAPLRPMLAIHLAPAALLATVAADAAIMPLAVPFLALAVLIALALIASARWIAAAGFSPLWGAFTFPLAALTSALFATGWDLPGLAVLAIACATIPLIVWRMLKLWATGSLAAKTNAAQA